MKLIIEPTGKPEWATADYYGRREWKALPDPYCAATAREHANVRTLADARALGDKICERVRRRQLASLRALVKAGPELGECPPPPTARDVLGAVLRAQHAALGRALAEDHAKRTDGQVAKAYRLTMEGRDCRLVSQL